MNIVPAFLFDMDGVIINSTRIHTEAWGRYLNQHGIEISDIEDRMLGKHNSDIVRNFFVGSDLNADIISEHGARKEAIFREMMGDIFEAMLVPGVTDFLRRHEGRPMALATNAERPNVDFVLERAGLQDIFGAIVDGHQVERPKPAPDIYLRAASLLGVEPETCIVFEDSLTGVEAARAARMRVVGVATTLDSFPGVDMTIKDFCVPDLERWLDSLPYRA